MWLSHELYVISVLSTCIYFAKTIVTIFFFLFCIYFYQKNIESNLVVVICLGREFGLDYTHEVKAFKSESNSGLYCMLRDEKFSVEFQQPQQQAHDRQWGEKCVKLVILWRAEAGEGSGFMQILKIVFSSRDVKMTFPGRQISYRNVSASIVSVWMWSCAVQRAELSW